MVCVTVTVYVFVLPAHVKATVRTSVLFVQLIVLPVKVVPFNFVTIEADAPLSAVTVSDDVELVVFPV